MRSCRNTNRRDAHQAFRLEAVDRAAPRDEPVGFCWRNSRLLGFLTGIDLYIEAERTAQLLRLLRQNGGQPFPIEGLDHVEEGHGVPGLVGLQGTDKTQLQSVTSTLPPELRLLYAVLTEYGLALGENCSHPVPWLLLGDGHEANLGRIPATGEGGKPHAFTDACDGGFRRKGRVHLHLTGRTGFWTLERTARCLKPPRRAGKPLPRLYLFTDPVRTPDPEAIASALPRGTCVVYRSFGDPSARATAKRLRKLCRRRGLWLLIGADARLAAQIKADGVHVPERMAGCLRRLRAAHPGWLITCAAHTPMGIVRLGRLPVDALVYSAIFASNSPSAGNPKGPLKLARVARSSRRPIIALGGVNAATAGRLRSTGISGIAAVEGLAGPRT